VYGVYPRIPPNTPLPLGLWGIRLYKWSGGMSAIGALLFYLLYATSTGVPVYHLELRGLNWDSAMQYCKDHYRNGHLLVVDSPEVQKAVSQYLDAFASQYLCFFTFVE